MTTALQYGLDTVETGILYSLVACGFYLASVGTRHFAFAAAVAFLVAPYAAVLFEGTPQRCAAAVVGVALCAGLGVAYRSVAAALSRRGSREGQLLIVSLAVMAIGWNLVAAVFGSESQTLTPSAVAAVHIIGVRVPLMQVVVVIVGGLCLAFLLYAWRSSLVGLTLRALLESRLNLALRGIPVAYVEATAAAAGFATIAISGLLWATDGRIKPAMCTEIGVIGAVAYIIGSIVRPGPSGLILAGFGLAVVRAGLSFTLEGDWAMTAMLVVLAGALLFRGRRPIRSGPES